MLSCWLYHECASDLSDTHKHARFVTLRGFRGIWLIYTCDEYCRHEDGFDFEVNDAGASLLETSREEALHGYNFLSTEAYDSAEPRWQEVL